MHKDARNGGPVSLEPIAARAESFDVMRWARELAGEPARSEALAGHSVERRQCAQAKRREDGERGVGSTGTSCIQRLRRQRTSAWGQCATHITQRGPVFGELLKFLSSEKKSSMVAFSGQKPVDPLLSPQRGKVQDQGKALWSESAQNKSQGRRS